MFENRVFQYRLLRQQLKLLQPRSIVDFGAGAGKVGEIAKDVLDDGYKIIAIEGNDKTAQMLNSIGLYHHVFNGLIMDWFEANSASFELAVFGDVLEHLPIGEVKKIIRKSSKIFDYIIVNVPLHEILQDGGDDLPLETHRSYITVKCFDKYRPTEKHIISDIDRPIGVGRRWIKLNVFIPCNTPKLPIHRLLSYWFYHLSMEILQEFGLAIAYSKVVRRIKYRK